MKLTLRSGLLLMLLLQSSTATVSAQQSRPELVDVGGHGLHARVVGSGETTFVLESGLGVTIDGWDAILPDLSKIGRVVLYERAGVGGSESGPLPRSSSVVAPELRTLLKELKVEPPYVLVGHSLGGLHARHFAQLYPDTVAGLVLIDPSPEKIRDRLKLSDEQLEKADRMMAETLNNWPQYMQDEWEGSKKSEDEVVGGAPLPDVPMLLFTSLQQVYQPADDEEREVVARSFRLKKQIHEELVAQVTVARHHVTEEFGHFIYRENPTWVVGEIRWLVEQVSENR